MVDNPICHSDRKDAGKKLSRFPASSRAESSGFTLVEMLVVIAVILTLLGLMVPVAKKLVGGRTVEQSINSVTGVLELGRATAIANRTYVYVLFSNSTNSDNTSELKCAVIMSMNGMSGVIDVSNLRPVSKLVTVPSIKNTKYTQMPAAVQNILPAELKVDDPYIAAGSNAEGLSDFPAVSVAGYSFKGATYIRFDDDGEIATSGDIYNLLVEPKICLGLVKTVGTKVQTAASDGAVVVCYGGTSKLSIFRP